MSIAEKPTSFPETRWSVVFQLHATSESTRQQALGDLCQIYWKPLYNFARRSGYSQHDAEDLTQGFLARLLRRENLGELEPDRGRFRTFLKVAFRNYTADEARRETRHKRGGMEEIISLDFESGERQYQRSLKDSSTPAEAYDRLWANTILRRVLTALRRKYQKRGRGETMRELEVFLADDEATPSYAEIAVKLDETENTIAAQVYRLRREFRQMLREEVADTLVNSADLDDEMRYLLRVVA